MGSLQGTTTVENLTHVFLVSFPGQGHVNPLLRLGKILAFKGLLVTFSAPEMVGEIIKGANKYISDDELTPIGDGMIRFEFFSDGLGNTKEDNSLRGNMDLYMPQLATFAKKSLSEILIKHEKHGRPVACLINNPFIPWISELAEEFNIPSAVLWVQSCASFSAYYHYHHGLVPFPTENEPERDVQLPNMPLLKYDEIPGFLLPSSPYGFLRRAILGQFKLLSKPICILVESFQELENDCINYLSTLCPIKPIGPLFSNPSVRNGSSIRGDFMKVEDCIDWLNTRADSSVVYVSFGSIVYVKQEQITEIARGLADSGLSFLWAFKQPGIDMGLTPPSLPDGFLEEVKGRGKVVEWCSQEAVLSHPAVSCFMSHCGWNSTMEALSSGVPVAAFPIWGDQVTDAKFLVDEFKVGIRMCRGEADINKKVVTREEIARCLLAATSGPKAEELKRNALKWKKAAADSVGAGGSSDRNLEEFVGSIRKDVVGH
uniref:Glycosyltransferase n=1 Tax=Lobelia erinus TaxID=16430 RepID=B0I1D7_LOBER|nr:UDP-glucose:hydroxycinnamate 1-O-glucosyltransferase [Lobelia erinus]BAF99687.1 UDP-glucose:hydroxycinnamate 1-O-glucosyltransferase [Lobelia erinus]